MAKPSKIPPANDLPPGLSQPALRALHGAGLYNLKLISKLGEKDLAKLHGIGPNAITNLKQAMGDKGLTFTD